MALPQITTTRTQGNYASYAVEPLEAGFGMTLGNTLRRVLLSSLPGAAVTAIRIAGVMHEFQDIPNVREDVTDIVLNVKRLRLRCFSDQPVSMHLEVVGERVVTAADIQAPAVVEIVNPDLYLATLDNQQARLAMDLIVEVGRGYVPGEPAEGTPIGEIPVDAIFTPVVKVNYTVEHTRVGQLTNFDRLLLEITTDGTITPEEALQRAAYLLVQHFSSIVDYRADVWERGQVPQSGLPIPPEIYNIPVEDLHLSVRGYNCLKRNNIVKVGQILVMEEEDLLAVRNFGEKSLIELVESLQERGFLPIQAGATAGEDGHLRG